MNPEKHEDNTRKVPRTPADHNKNPVNKFEGKFDNKDTPQKPFERLYDYVANLKGLETALKKGEEFYFDYLEQNQMMMPEKYLETIGKTNKEVEGDLRVEFLKRNGSLDDLSDIVSFVNDPGNFMAANSSLQRLRMFLFQE
jgi:hypothetical protein